MPGLPGRRVPPLQFDRGQLVTSGGRYHIADTVLALATDRAPTAITEGRNTGCLHVAFKAFDFNQRGRRYQHRLRTFGAGEHVAGDAIPCPQRRMRQRCSLLKADLSRHQAVHGRIAGQGLGNK
ncbi:hypothetical protein D3C80_1303350 [compost metagenome]